MLPNGRFEEVKLGGAGVEAGVEVFEVGEFGGEDFEYVGIVLDVDGVVDEVLHVHQAPQEQGQLQEQEERPQRHVSQNATKVD